MVQMKIWAPKLAKCFGRAEGIFQETQADSKYLRMLWAEALRSVQSQAQA